MDKKEKNRIRALAWYHKNKEKCLARQKEWRESPSGKKWIREWSKKDRESGNANNRCRKSYWKNPEKYREKGRNEHWENREANLLRMKKWRSSEHGKKYLKTYTQEHRMQTVARYAKRNAFRRGEIVPMPCEACGILPAQGHHPDYTKPLEVQWLCLKHHRQLHRKLKKNSIK